jgi:hypothetical protein
MLEDLDNSKEEGFHAALKNAMLLAHLKGYECTAAAELRSGLTLLKTASANLHYNTLAIGLEEYLPLEAVLERLCAQSVQPLLEVHLIEMLRSVLENCVKLQELGVSHNDLTLHNIGF